VGEEMAERVEWRDHQRSWRSPVKRGLGFRPPELHPPFSEHKIAATLTISHINYYCRSIGPKIPKPVGHAN
jgi:hypothetical protein